MVLSSNNFVEEFTYGESLPFDEAISSLSDLTNRLTSLNRSKIQLDKATSNKLTLKSLLEEFKKLEINLQNEPIDIKSTIDNLLVPIAEDEPRATQLIRDLQGYARHHDTQQMSLSTFLSKLETTNSLSRKPTIITATRNIESSESSALTQADDLGMSM